jgi:hypothetical protein
MQFTKVTLIFVFNLIYYYIKKEYICRTHEEKIALIHPFLQDPENLKKYLKELITQAGFVVRRSLEGLFFHTLPFLFNLLL